MHFGIAASFCCRHHVFWGEQPPLAVGKWLRAHDEDDVPVSSLRHSAHKRIYCIAGLTGKVEERRNNPRGARRPPRWPALEKLWQHTVTRPAEQRRWSGRLAGSPMSNP